MLVNENLTVTFFLPLNFIIGQVNEINFFQELVICSQVRNIVKTKQNVFNN